MFMTFFQPVRPGAWGKFSTPSVINKTVISGSFNNYSSGFGCGMPTMGGFGVGMPMMGGCTMDYGCGGGGWKSFLGGFFGGFLGGLLGGGGNSSAVGLYGGGGGGTTVGAGGNEVDGLQKLLGKDYNVSFLNGEYAVKDKDGNILTGKTPQDIIDQINGGADGADGAKGTRSTGDGRETALKELREEADKFNKDNGTNGFNLSVNDNPNGEDGKGNDLQYTLTYTDSKGKTHTSEYRTVPTPGQLQQFKDGIENRISSGNDDGAGDAKGAGEADGKGDGVQDDGGRGAQNVPGGTNEAFEKIFGKGVLPEGCEAVKGDDGKFAGVKYNDKVYTTPDALMKAINGFDLVSSDGFQLSSLEGKTFDIIDHGDVGDIAGAEAGKPSGDTIKIGTHTYKVVSTDDSGHVYLKATDDPRQTEIYILEQQGTDKFRLSQYKYTESGQTRGQGKAAYAGLSDNIA